MTMPFNPIVNQTYAGAVSALLTGLRNHLRKELPQGDVKTVDFYGGEFDEEEIPKSEYACPAVFVTCLGFGRNENTTRQTGKYAKTARIAVFVATKHGTREGRFVECVDLVERISTLVTMWQPQCPPPVNAAANAAIGSTGQPAPQSCVLPAEPQSFVAENLYNRKLDAHKHALWLLSWSQGFEAVHGLDAITLPDLNTIHADSTLITQVPDPVPPVLNPLIAESCVIINPQP